MVQRVVRTRVNQLRYCYERAQRADPTIRGELELGFTITPEGRVSGASIARSTLSSPPVESCFQASVSRWTFPRPTGGAPVTVRQLFRLQPKPGGRPMMTSPIGSRYVVTRLHTRYDRKTLSEDLVFREAPPVVGGRATSIGGMGDNGAAIQGAQNNFQARYIIRHYWPKKVACQQPRYGNWGGPPGLGGLSQLGGMGGGAGTAQPATSLGRAPRGRVRLADVIHSPVPLLGLAGKKRAMRPGEAR